MIDLDAIKASGRNSAEHSAQLLALHLWRERVRLAGEMCTMYLRSTDGTSSEEFEDFFHCAYADAHAAVMLFELAKIEGHI